MKKFIGLIALATMLLALSSAPLVLAQNKEAAPPAADNAEVEKAAEAKSESSQEVEINEDTYRQFMELKDANRQGDIIPETAFKPGSGLQKLDKLPEESQKHLRNELREIIVQGDPWQPGDENADYPYTPSAAASNNPALQKQEMEAWGELVDSYNQREAQIYADRAGNRATMNPQEGRGDQPGSGADKQGKDGADKEGVPGQPAEQEANPDRADTPGSFSPDAVHDPNAQGDSGVSQNALEFLRGLGANGKDAGGENAGKPQGSGGQQGSAGNQGQPQPSQQDAARQAGNTADAAQNPSANAESGSAGTKQNAMEFLNQAGAQAGNTEGNKQGAAAGSEQGQNAAPTAQAQDQQSGQENGQSTAQNSARGSAQGEQQADGEEAGEQGEGQAGSQADGKAMAGLQSETAEKKVSVPAPDEDFTFGTSAAEEESTVGSTQNALEFLTDEGAVSAKAADSATETSPPPAGTLNIQDLLNAQGVGGTAGTEPANPASGEDKPTGQTKTDKDGGGR